MITSAEEFARLRRSDEPEEYNRANDEDAPLAVWLDVYRKYPEFRKYIAMNGTSPVEILRILADDEDWLVRSVVADRTDAGDYLLQKLAHDKHEGVRGRVCWNSATPRSALEHLAATEWFEPNLERISQRLAQLG